MSTVIERVVRRLEAQGVSLSVSGSKLRYKAPRRLLTPAVMGLLNVKRRELIEYLTSRPPISSPVPPIASVIGRLAACGVTLRIVGGVPIPEFAVDADVAGGRRLLDGLRGREAEILDFFDKTEDDLSDEELDALGYRRREPGARILLDSDHDEPAWTPPRGWGLEP